MRVVVLVQSEFISEAWRKAWMVGRLKERTSNLAMRSGGQTARAETFDVSSFGGDGNCILSSMRKVGIRQSEALTRFVVARWFAACTCRPYLTFKGSQSAETSL